MSDVIGRFFIILIGTIMLFFVPVTIIATKQDTTKQNAIDNKVVEFVDNARATGQISKDEYENLATYIYTFCSPCEIKIYHGCKSVLPADENSFANTQEYYTTEDILNKIINLSEDGKYELKKGDYLKVEVYNEEPTLGQILLSVVMMGHMEEKSIFTTYGGYVGNNIQNYQ